MRRLLRYLKRLKKLSDYKKRGICICNNVELGDNDLGDHVNIAHHAQVTSSTVGLRTSIGRYTKVRFANIGKYCSISWDCTIGATAHPLHSLSSHAFTYRSQFGLVDKNSEITHEYVNIGNDVWIGCGVIILPGVTIGDGAVIGA